MTERISNIGERGARRRMLSGVAWLALSAGGLIALLVSGAPRFARLGLVIPLALAAMGFLQSRGKT